MGKKALALFGAVATVVYILNPTVGVFEFIPDNLPIFGNLDEATATAALIWCVKTLFGKSEKELDDILDDNKN